jgi:hypothetical protein
VGLSAAAGLFARQRLSSQRCRRWHVAFVAGGVLSLVVVAHSPFVRKPPAVAALVH